MKDIRVGTGYDVHQLVQGRPLILGGIPIEHPLGLAGHSDADVLLHAIIDAMFGSLALGDIGTHFPDDDQKFKDINSRKLLAEAAEIIYAKGWKISNIDSSVVAQAPKLAPYIKSMAANIAGVLDIAASRVSVKATTSEQLGFEGKEEGISAQATVLVYKE